MGIKGLPQFLRDKGLVQRTALESFKDEVVGVDMSGYIHRAIGATRPSSQVVAAYVLKNIDFLLAKGIRPYAVFDGARPPLKASRRGPTNRTHEDAVQTIIGLRARKVPYLVAPMEADSQLVHLEQIGITSATLTLDHDLVILGSQKVLLINPKAPMSGQVNVFNRPAADARPELAGWTQQTYHVWAALAGSDFADNLPRHNARKVYDLLHQKPTATFTNVLENVGLKDHAQIEDLKIGWGMAVLAMAFGVVYDPGTKAQRFLRPWPEEDGDKEGWLQESVVGRLASPTDAESLADGSIHPSTGILVPALLGKSGPDADKAEARRLCRSAAGKRRAVKHGAATVAKINAQADEAVRQELSRPTSPAEHRLERAKARMSTLASSVQDPAFEWDAFDAAWPNAQETLSALAELADRPHDAALQAHIFAPIELEDEAEEEAEEDEACEDATGEMSATFYLRVFTGKAEEGKTLGRTLADFIGKFDREAPAQRPAFATILAGLVRAFAPDIVEDIVRSDNPYKVLLATATGLCESDTGEMSMRLLYAGTSVATDGGHRALQDEAGTLQTALGRFLDIGGHVFDTKVYELVGLRVPVGSVAEARRSTEVNLAERVIVSMVYPASFNSCTGGLLRRTLPSAEAVDIARAFRSAPVHPLAAEVISALADVRFTPDDERDARARPDRIVEILRDARSFFEARGRPVNDDVFEMIATLLSPRPLPSARPLVLLKDITRADLSGRTAFWDASGIDAMATQLAAALNVGLDEVRGRLPFSDVWQFVPKHRLDGACVVHLLHLLRDLDPAVVITGGEAVTALFKEGSVVNTFKKHGPSVDAYTRSTTALPKDIDRMMVCGATIAGYTDYVGKLALLEGVRPILALPVFDGGHLRHDQGARALITNVNTVAFGLAYLASAVVDIVVNAVGMPEEVEVRRSLLLKVKQVVDGWMAAEGLHARVERQRMALKDHFKTTRAARALGGATRLARDPEAQAAASKAKALLSSTILKRTHARSETTSQTLPAAPELLVDCFALAHHLTFRDQRYAQALPMPEPHIPAHRREKLGSAGWFFQHLVLDVDALSMVKPEGDQCDRLLEFVARVHEHRCELASGSRSSSDRIYDVGSLGDMALFTHAGANSEEKAQTALRTKWERLVAQVSYIIEAKGIDFLTHSHPVTITELELLNQHPYPLSTLNPSRPPSGRVSLNASMVGGGNRPLDSHDPQNKVLEAVERDCKRTGRTLEEALVQGAPKRDSQPQAGPSTAAGPSTSAHPLTSSSPYLRLQRATRHPDCGECGAPWVPGGPTCSCGQGLSKEAKRTWTAEQTQTLQGWLEVTDNPTDSQVDQILVELDRPDARTRVKNWFRNKRQLKRQVVPA